MISVLIVYGLFVAWHFPWDTDPVLKESNSSVAQTFYDQAFDSEPAEESAAETQYERTARLAAEAAGVKGLVTDFVRRNGLESQKVLEVGAGKGTLQDIVPDYTGLDLSASARKHFHKPFVRASATNMPFRDSAFDGIWSIWVLEHIPNPEHALLEMRRVVKDGGYLFLMPSWNCSWWAAEGYAVRPYADFGFWGKLIKAGIPLVSSRWYQLSFRFPVIMARGLSPHEGPTQLRFRRIKPNYDKYWQPDSDAVISLDPSEATWWFTSRGDECLNCDRGSVNSPHRPLILRVHKSNAKVNPT